MSTTHCLAPAGDVEAGDLPPESTSATTHLRDWIAEVAGKLTRREGRNDLARHSEIVDWCREAAMQFADAPIQAYVPLLVERIVGDRIRRNRERRTGGYGPLRTPSVVSAGILINSLLSLVLSAKPRNRRRTGRMRKYPARLTRAPSTRPARTSRG